MKDTPEAERNDYYFGLKMDEKRDQSDNVDEALWWAKLYVRVQSIADKFQLILMPDYCLVKKQVKLGQMDYVPVVGPNGKAGFDSQPHINDALMRWKKIKGIFDLRMVEGAADVSERSAEYLRRKQSLYNDINIGLSRKTESYSVLQPEVDPEILGRYYKQQLQEEDRSHENIREIMYKWKYENYDILVILVCGEALSHKILCTVRDMCDLVEINSSRINVLKNCSSCIEGYSETLIHEELEQLGVQITTDEAFFRDYILRNRGGDVDNDDDVDKEHQQNAQPYAPDRWPVPYLPRSERTPHVAEASVNKTPEISYHEKPSLATGTPAEPQNQPDLAGAPSHTEIAGFRQKEVPVHYSTSRP